MSYISKYPSNVYNDMGIMRGEGMVPTRRVSKRTGLPIQRKRGCLPNTCALKFKRGSKRQVWNGTALMTPGKLKLAQLMRNPKSGKIVSKKAYAHGRAVYERYGFQPGPGGPKPRRPITKDYPRQSYMLPPPSYTLPPAQIGN